LPKALDHLASVVVDGKIYAVGGETGHADFDGNATYIQFPNLYVYDPAGDEWTRLADMPGGRSHAETSTFVVNNKIYVLGGRIDAARATTGVVEYDPITNVWKQLNPLPEARHGAVGAWYDDKFIILGGQMGTGALLKSTIIGSFQLTVL
jgi:N-acetylneuraminic acid mutarotase